MLLQVGSRPRGGATSFAQSDSICLLQVSITEHIALPLRVHRGRPEDGIMLHASACYGEKKEPRYNYLTIRWGQQQRSALSYDRKRGPNLHGMGQGGG